MVSMHRSEASYPSPMYRAGHPEAFVITGCEVAGQPLAISAEPALCMDDAS